MQTLEECGLHCGNIIINHLAGEPRELECFSEVVEEFKSLKQTLG